MPLRAAREKHVPRFELIVLKLKYNVIRVIYLYYARASDCTDGTDDDFGNLKKKQDIPSEKREFLDILYEILRLFT